jgi:hypothetical protein
MRFNLTCTSGALTEILSNEATLCGWLKMGKALSGKSSQQNGFRDAVMRDDPDCGKSRESSQVGDNSRRHIRASSC